MSQFTPAMDQALAAARPLIFGAVEIVLPEHTIRLLTGSGQVEFGGRTFTGQDNSYGSIHSIEDLTDGQGDDAPELQLTLAPRSTAAAIDICKASHQGSAVSMWMGVLDRASGLVIPDPLLVFLGELDVPRLRGGKNSRLLELEITSAFEHFFFNDDGARLSDQFHQYLWPGETGLAQCLAVLRQIYWGASPPSGVSL